MSFGWMGIMEELSLNSDVIYYGIIPTVLIPLSLVSFGLSMVASFIAGLFGIKLSTEGPRKLLELVFKPRFIAIAIVMNLFFYGAVKGYEYISHMPTTTLRLNMINKEQPIEKSYPDNHGAHFAFSLNSKAQFKPLELQKELKINVGPFYSPIVSGGSVFLGNDDGDFLEIDEHDLKVTRILKTKTMITPSILIDKGFAYYGEGEHATHHARIYKVDLKNFKIVNFFTTKGHTEGSATIQGEDIYFPAGDDGIYKVNLDSMKKLWQAKIGHSDAQVVVDETNVYAASALDSRRAGDFPFAYALDRETGDIIWKRQLVASSWFRPLLIKDKICYISGEIYFDSEIGALECFNKNNGMIINSHRFNEPVTSTFITVDDSIVVTTSKGNICSLESETLKQNWCTSTGETKRSYSAPMYDEFRNVLLYATRKNGLFVLEPRTGVVLQQIKYNEGDSVYARPVVTKDYVLLATMKGFIQKFN